MTDYVGYARVSTAKQGRSGLGLEAQEAAIRAHIKAEDKLLMPIYVEVESGKRSDRPELENALRHAKLTGATLLVAKLDRLSRDVRFLLTLIDSGVDVLFCDLPQLPAGPIGRFMLTQMAAIAELEAGMISQRTKAALQAAKERGQTLGGFRGVKVNPTLGRAARSVKAQQFNERVREALVSIRQARGGDLSLNEMARELNNRSIRTSRGGEWSAVQVARVIGQRGLEI